MKWKSHVHALSCIHWSCVTYTEDIKSIIILLKYGAKLNRQRSEFIRRYYRYINSTAHEKRGR